MYWIHKPDTHLQIETQQATERVFERIGADLARVRSVVWSPVFGAQTFYVGVLEPPSIEMRVCHGYSNGFARLLDGRVEPPPSDSVLSLRFRSIWWIELLVRAIEVIMLGPVVAYSIALFLYAQRGGAADWSRLWVVAAGPALTVVLLVGIEAVARRLGDQGDRRMREALLS